MASVEKISIALSPDLLQQVRSAVESGKYGSASEVVREALREWALREPLRTAEVERLRKAWANGLSSGQVRPFDIDQIKAEARRRLAGQAARDD